jgi:hypothetical protein
MSLEFLSFLPLNKIQILLKRLWNLMWFVTSLFKYYAVWMSSAYQKRKMKHFHSVYWDPSRWPHGTFYSQKLALTSKTSSGRSVGIVRSRAQATESSFLVWYCHATRSVPACDECDRPYVKWKLIPETDIVGLQGFEKSRIPHFLHSRLTDGVEVVSHTRLPFFTPRNISGTYCC